MKVVSDAEVTKYHSWTPGSGPDSHSVLRRSKEIMERKLGDFPANRV